MLDAKLGSGSFKGTAHVAGKARKSLLIILGASILLE